MIDLVFIIVCVNLLWFILGIMLSTEDDTLVRLKKLPSHKFLLATSLIFSPLMMVVLLLVNYIINFLEWLPIPKWWERFINWLWEEDK